MVDSVTAAVLEGMRKRLYCFGAYVIGGSEQEAEPRACRSTIFHCIGMSLLGPRKHPPERL